MYSFFYTAVFIIKNEKKLCSSHYMVRKLTPLLGSRDPENHLQAF